MSKKLFPLKTFQQDAILKRLNELSKGGLPEIEEGDDGKVLGVNGDKYELVTIQEPTIKHIYKVDLARQAYTYDFMFEWSTEDLITTIDEMKNKLTEYIANLNTHPQFKRIEVITMNASSTELTILNWQSLTVVNNVLKGNYAEYKIALDGSGVTKSSNTVNLNVEDFIMLE